jgi:ABC transporter substrate binding protein (PQQ-dependent alcohol dehydrogenase system)
MRHDARPPGAQGEDQGEPLIRAVITCAFVWIVTAAPIAAEPVTIKIGYVGRVPEKKVPISLLDYPPDNNGVAGARLALTDNNGTGRFLNQRFEIEDVRLKEGADPADAVTQMADGGALFIILDLPADQLLKVADAGRGRGLVFFNAGATDDRLREEDCRANVIHTAPTRSMLADGLAQFLIVKRWQRWLLVVGSHDTDKLFADALRRAATKFGAKIVEERVFEDTGGGRRNDSGLTQVQSQIPLFLQGAASHDVLVAADESEVFADYLPYRTREPRPVAGSAGLVPKSWDPAMDQWGAEQLQNRFMQMFSRRMTALDMQAWTAVRMIGEAATRTASGDSHAVLAYIKGPGFGLAAFKGQKITLRDWNLQLRQPILLADGRTITSVSPQVGFQHQFSELDTLGFDRPETKCRLK